MCPYMSFFTGVHQVGGGQCDTPKKGHMCPFLLLYVVALVAS